MKAAGILGKYNYWLASLNGYDTYAMRCRFSFWNNQNWSVSFNWMVYFSEGSQTSHTLGFRPVIKLRPEVKITGGSGTSASPYKLGI